MSIINDALKKAQASLQQNSLTPQNHSAPQTKPNKISETSPIPPTSADQKGISQPPTYPPKKSLATIEQKEKEKEKRGEKTLAKAALRTPKTTQGPGDFSPVTRIVFLSFILISILAFLIYKNPLQWKFKKITLPFSKQNAQAAQKKKLLALFGRTEGQNRTLRKREGLYLEGVITQNGKQFALINDEVYQEGSFVEGKKVLSISLDRVLLLDNGNTITLINKSAAKE